MEAANPADRRVTPAAPDASSCPSQACSGRGGDAGLKTHTPGSTGRSIDARRKRARLPTGAPRVKKPLAEGATWAASHRGFLHAIGHRGGSGGSYPLGGWGTVVGATWRRATRRVLAGQHCAGPFAAPERRHDKNRERRSVAPRAPARHLRAGPRTLQHGPHETAAVIASRGSGALAFPPHPPPGPAPSAALSLEPAASLEAPRLPASGQPIRTLTRRNAPHEENK